MSAHMNEHACQMWSSVERVVRNGGVLSITLPAHDKSLHLKPIHSSGKWTMENRAEVNERGEGGNERWSTTITKKVGGFLSLKVKTSE